MADKFMNPQCKPSEAPGGGHFSEDASPMKPDRFTTGGRNPPTHNPQYPWMGLPEGPHTHAGAREAVHNARTPTPGFDAGYTGMAKNLPSPSMTQKSMSQKDNRRVPVMRDDVAAHRTDVPKGNRDGG